MFPEDCSDVFQRCSQLVQEWFKYVRGLSNMFKDVSDILKRCSIYYTRVCLNMLQRFLSETFRGFEKTHMRFRDFSSEISEHRPHEVNYLPNPSGYYYLLAPVALPELTTDDCPTCLTLCWSIRKLSGSTVGAFGDDFHCQNSNLNKILSEKSYMKNHRK